MAKTNSNIPKYKIIKLLSLVILFSLFLSNPGYTQSFFSDQVKKSWETEAVFKVPESVLYDTSREMIYVSNINGSPNQAIGNGFLSLLKPNGDIVKLEWITGLHAPKGMTVFEGKLYVADINRLAEIDIEQGKIINFYDAAGAQFLNDVTCDEQGNIYISDMASGSVYKLSDDKIIEWFPGGTFERPNGMYYLDGMIFLGTSGKILSINPNNKAIKTQLTFDGGVDGLEIDMEGNFIFSDWSGKVQKATPGQQPEILFNTTADLINAADIHFIRDKNILLVPTFSDNRIMAYELIK